MLSLEKYSRIKERVAELKAERDRAVGALDQLLATLQKEHGCQTLEEAKQKLLELEQQYEKQSAKFEQLLAQFEERWREQLDPISPKNK